MEKLRLVLEIAGGIILVGGFLAAIWGRIVRAARAYIAPKVTFTLKYCSTYGDVLSVNYVFKAKVSCTVAVESTGLYELESITKGQVVTTGRIEELAKDGTSGRFLACVSTRYKEFSDFERLRPFVRDASGNLFLGEPIDPDELRAAFDPDRNDRLILPPPLCRRATAFPI